MANEIKNIAIKNNVYITTTINNETCNDVIINLSQWLQGLPFKEKTDLTFAPFAELPAGTSVLNVYISSYGGDMDVAKSILSLLNIAKAKNVIVKTYNMSNAHSGASMIAVSGTQGYRYMAHNAANGIHFGKHTETMSRLPEVPLMIEDMERVKQQMQDIYLENTKLTKKELKKFFTIEGSGTLNAVQCLTKGICDYVITPKGWTNKIEDLKQQIR